MTLIFASHNTHKTDEVRAILAPTGIRIKSLKDISFAEDIEETGATFQENAALKVQAIYTKTGFNAFADDSGLEVEVLNNAPGVYSARYAGILATHEANNAKLLKALEGKENRKACFKTVIALMIDGVIHYFEGRVDGHITEVLGGTQGFGYDPLFIPEGYNQTFAEMSPELKNSMSHRKRALEHMLAYFGSGNNGNLPDLDNGK